MRLSVWGWVLAAVSIRGLPLSRLPFDPWRSHEIAFAEVHALCSQDRVRGRRMEVEVGLRERKQEVGSRERQLGLSEGEVGVCLGQFVDRRPIECGELGVGPLKNVAQTVEVGRPGVPIGRETARSCALDPTDQVHGASR